MTYREALATLSRCPPGEGWHTSARTLENDRWTWVVVTEKPR